MSHFLDNADFLAVIRDAPLISIDLIVTDASGNVLLGQRKNAPAKDYWFVPGGRIYKNETLDSAFRRISETELGNVFERETAEFLGNYEHIYEDNFAHVQGIGTHYVVIAYKILMDRVALKLPNTQHLSYLWMSPRELLINKDVHLNTKGYFYNK